MKYIKDGEIKDLKQLKRLYPYISFGTNTPTVLGYTEYVAPPYVITEQDLRAEAKLKRMKDVASIKVTTTSGKVFDGNEEAQSRMSRAITVAQIAGLTETTWVLADNTVATVTLGELQEALVLSGLRQSELWVLP